MTTPPLRFGIQAAGPVDPVGWTEVAKRAESLGYSVLTMADHFSNAMAPFPALAIAAAATTTLRVGTVVLGNDFRHPAVVARDAATLDALSGGRLELGIGAGWMTTDYTTTGIELETPGRRIERLDESVRIITQLLAGESVTFAGDHYTLAGLDGFSGAQVKIPIFMGGGGPRMLATAGRLADIVGINPNLSAGVIDERAGPDATIERTVQKLDWVRKAAGPRFGAVEIQSRIHVAMITDDRDDVLAALAPAMGLTLDQAKTSPHALVGTIEEICDKITSLHTEYGFSYFTWSADVLEDMAPIVDRLG